MKPYEYKKIAQSFGATSQEVKSDIANLSNTPKWIFDLVSIETTQQVLIDNYRIRNNSYKRELFVK